MSAHLLPPLRPTGQFLALLVAQATLAACGSAARGQQFPMEERAKLSGMPNFVKTVCFSPDGKRLAANGSGIVKVWDTTTLKEIVTLKGLRAAHITFSPDSKLLAMTGFEEPARVYDTGTWKIRAKLAGHPRGTRWVEFTPDGKSLATADFGEAVQFWDPVKGKDLGPSFMPGLLDLYPLVFTPDGKTMAAAGQDKVVLYDLAAKKVRARLEGHTNRVPTLALSPDGKTLLTADLSLKKRVILWDVATGKRQLQLDLSKFSSIQVYAAAFSPNGKTVAVVGFSPFVHLYDATTGRERAVLKSTNDYYLSVAFSPDGRTLVTGGAGGTVKLWDVPKMNEGNNGRESN